MVKSQTEGTIRIGGTSGIPEVLKELGVNPDEFLKQSGLDPAIFNDPDNKISFAARSLLIQKCVKITGCEHFGFLVGKKGSLSSLGILGYLVHHSLNVGVALRSLVRHFHIHSQASSVVLVLEDDYAFLGYRIHSADIPAADQTEDGAIALIFNIMQQLCGQDWRPSEVCFEHKKPQNIRPYSQFFQAPLRFNAECSGVYFPLETLRQPVTEADPELHRLLQKQIEQIEASHKDDFPQQVRQILCTAFQTGHSSAEDVAALFSIHSRTLHRRLHEYGTNFHKESDICRFEIAKQLLQQTSSEVIQIAETLNYADLRSFNKAFKRWSDMTPTQWRKKHSQD